MIIRQQGGRILDRNTDAIRYERNEPINIKNYYWENNHDMRDKNQSLVVGGTLKYQAENNKPLKYEMLPHYKRTFEGDLNFDFDKMNWNVKQNYEGFDKEDWQTYLILSHIKNKLALAPTNVSAKLINGVTIHKLFYQFEQHPKVFYKIMNNVECVFIDEISMVDESYYKVFQMIKRVYPKMRFIISGDFAQLPPVEDDWNGNYEDNNALRILCDGNKIVLTECRRADKEYFELCNNPENIKIEDFPFDELTFQNLAYCHDTRKRVNNECMNAFISQKQIKQTYLIKALPKNIKSQDIQLAVGMPVIAHRNMIQLKILNSEKFTVKAISRQKGITLLDELEENEVVVSFEKFPRIFYLGFCITIHSSQGCTIKGKYTIHDWERIGHSNIEKKLKYVALSRGTTKTQTQITR